MGSKIYRPAPLWPVALIGVSLVFVLAAPFVSDWWLTHVVAPVLLISGPPFAVYARRIVKKPVPGSKQHRLLLQNKVRQAGKNRVKND